MTTPDPRDEDLASLVERQARNYGDKTFMSFGDGTSMSFAEFGDRVAAFRDLLRRRGVGPGDRVALMLKNSLFYPVAWLGVVTGGSVAVPVNSRLGPDDTRFIFGHSGATFAVTDDVTESVARAGAAGTGVTDLFVARTGDAMADALDGVAIKEPHMEAGLHAGMLANIQYTSGTTGFPKGCLLSHRYWQRMGAASTEFLRLDEHETILTSQAHSYIDPQWNVVAALRSGAHLVLLDGFHPTTFMRDVARFGVTVFYCLGVMPTLLLKQPPAVHDRGHSLKRVACSAIPAEHHAAIEERWGAPWFELFGMTESGVNIGVSDEDHDQAMGTSCIGRALWHNEAMVVDEFDREVGPNEVGELVFRGLGFMEGYHDDPEATAEFFRNGWAHSGDLCSVDEGGLIFYRGRRKEMIRRGGENIAPAEIETALSTHEDVVECAVTSVPDPDMGEEIKAYVVLRPGTEFDASDLAAHLAGRVARFKVPRFWEARDGLPHTPSEKIIKSKLEEGRADWRQNTIDMKL